MAYRRSFQRGRVVGILVIVLGMNFSARASLAAPGQRPHLGPPRYVSPNLSRRVRLSGGVGSHVRHSVAGRLTGPANAAAAATTLALQHDLAMAGALALAGYLGLDKQLDRASTHAGSQRAFARAELARIEGLPGARAELLKGAGLRVVESTARGGLSGTSLAMFFAGLCAIRGISPETVAKATAIAGLSGSALGFINGLVGATRATIGRSVARSVNRRLLERRLARAEGQLERLLDEHEPVARGSGVATLERHTRYLRRKAEQIGVLDATQTARIERVIAGHAALLAFGLPDHSIRSVPPARPTLERKARWRKRLTRLVALGLLAATLTEQALLPRVPLDMMPSDVLPAGPRRDLAQLVWQQSARPEVKRYVDESIERGESMLFGTLPPSTDSRLLSAALVANRYRNHYDSSPSTRIDVALGRLLLPRKPEWDASVRADVEHFYTAAVMATMGGVTAGPVFAALASGVYEGPVSMLTYGAQYDTRYQTRQLLRADLPGAVVGSFAPLVEFRISD